MAQIYKSSNNCKLTTHSSNGTSKSMDKPTKKYTCNQMYSNNLSLEKHYNKDILMKTQARGFFIDQSDDKLSGYDNNSKKSTELTWQSTNQLPFLLMGTSNGSYENTTRKN